MNKLEIAKSLLREEITKALYSSNPFKAQIQAKTRAKKYDLIAGKRLNQAKRATKDIGRGRNVSQAEYNIKTAAASNLNKKANKATIGKEDTQVRERIANDDAVKRSRGTREQKNLLREYKKDVKPKLFNPKRKEKPVEAAKKDQKMLAAPKKDSITGMQESITQAQSARAEKAQPKKRSFFGLRLKKGDN